MTSETTPPGDTDKTPRRKRLAWPRWVVWLVVRWGRIGYGRRVAICAGLYIFLAFFTVLIAPRWLLGEWIPNSSVDDQGKLLGTAGNLVLLALGGVIAVVTVGLSLARHRQEVEAAHRDRQRLELDQAREQARIDEVKAQRTTETERALRQRFVTTVQLLSDPAPVNRQAALYALGALADDWDAFGKPDQVQVCIEVITGYLRAPRSKDMLLPLDAEDAHRTLEEDYYFAQRTTRQEISVKQAGFSVIRNHLQMGAKPDWHERHVNLSRAHIDFPVELSLVHMRQNGILDLRKAHISHEGAVDMSGTHVSAGGRVLFTDGLIVGPGSLSMRATSTTSRGTIDLGYLTLDGAQVDMDKSGVFDHGSIDARGVRLINRGSLSIRGAAVGDGGVILLNESGIEFSARLDLRRMSIKDFGSVEMNITVVEAGGVVDLSSATVEGKGRLELEGVVIGRDSGMSLKDLETRDGATVDLSAIQTRAGGSLRLPDGLVIFGTE